MPRPGIEQSLYPRDDFLEPQAVFENLAAIPADLPVLAIAALQVAAREKDVADAALSAEDRLLAAMNADRADAEIGARSTIAEFAFQPPRMALPRATHAVA
jgi:putative heme iron utilization protein